MNEPKELLNFDRKELELLDKLLDNVDVRSKEHIKMLFRLISKIERALHRLKTPEPECDDEAAGCPPCI